MNRFMTAAAIVAVLAAAAPRSVPAQEPLASLRPALEERIAEFRGTVHAAVIDLASGEELSIRGDEPVPSASVIKVPLLVELFHQVEEGRLSLEDPLILLESDKVPGSGVLQHFHAPHQLSMRDAATLMIILSDNSATNLVIDRVGIRPVWDRMEALGLPRTKLHSKSFVRATSVAMDSSRVYGLGVTTASEMARLLAMLYRGEAVSPAADSQMVAILRRQHYSEGIPRHLPPEASIANKTGALNAARHDCGIVYGPRRDYVLCVLTNENEDQGWRVDVEPHLLIADLALLVHRHLNGPT